MWGGGLRVGLVIGVVAVSAMAIASCDDSSPKSSTLRISTVGRSMAEAGTARVVGHGLTVDSSGKRQSRSTFVGQIDYTNDRSSMTIRSGSGRRVQVTRSRSIGRYLYVSPADTMVSPPEVSTRTVPSTAGKQWSRVPYASRTGPLQLGSFGDASELMEGLTRDGGKPDEIGSADVRGVTTRHFRVEVAHPDAPAQVRATTFTGPRRTTFDLWIDAENRLRRFGVSVQIGSAHTESVLEFFDFGAPVTIDPPPPASVVVDTTTALTGDWALVQHGRGGGNSWRIYMATTASGFCFSEETTPRGRTTAAFPVQRGRPVESCQSTGDGSGSRIGDDVTVRALSLPNGMALLFGHVAPEAKRVTLQYADGRRQDLTPSRETFSAGLAPAAVVETIVLHGEDTDVRCPLRKQVRSYLCSDSFAPLPSGPTSPIVPGNVEPALPTP